MTGVGQYIFLALAIVAAQAVETVTGFGATIIALAIGAYVMPVEELVVTLIVIGVLQSAWLVARGYRHIEWKILLEFILPLCAIGLLAGRMLAEHMGGVNLRFILGIFVAVVSVTELHKIFNGNGSKGLSRPAGSLALFSGGVIHGIFGTGGPLVVFYASRVITSKAAFRATLSILWLLLNVIFLAAWLVEGRFSARPLETAGFMLPALALGIMVGEIIHGRVNERIFRIAVQSVLVIVGVLLILR